MAEIDLCFEGSYSLIAKLTGKLYGSTDKEKQAVKLLASLVLCLWHWLKCSSQAEAVDATSKLDKCSLYLYRLMKDWVVHFNVIGSNLFGGGLSNKKEQETKVM